MFYEKHRRVSRTNLNFKFKVMLSELGMGLHVPLCLSFSDFTGVDLCHTQQLTVTFQFDTYNM